MRGEKDENKDAKRWTKYPESHTQYSHNLYTHTTTIFLTPPPLYPHFKKREREKKMVGGGRKRNKRDERRKCSSTSLPRGYITRALWNNFISRLLSQFSSENYYHSCSSLYLYPLFWRLFRCIPFSF